jgi:hypothetical protein
MNDDQTKQKIAELEALRSAVRTWRLVSVLLVILIVVVCVWSVVHSLRSLTREGPQQQEFTRAFAEGFHERVLPPAQDMVRQTVHELSPVVIEEFQKLNARVPELTAALQTEGQALMENLPRRAEKVLDAQFTALMKQREAKIRKMFPDASEEKIGQVVNNLIEEGGVHMASVLDDMFKPHEEVFHDILTHLYTIQEMEAEHVKDETPTWEMAVLLFDAVRDDLQDLDSMEYAEALRESAKQAVEQVKETVQNLVP